MAELFLSVLNLALMASAVLFGLPVLVLLSQVLLAPRWPGSGDGRRDAATPDRPDAGPTPAVAVLIPAHNEATGIARTLQSIVPQLGARSRVLVVADNCSDATADVARTHGAEVVERIHASLRGKGYALDFGVHHLATQVPDVVVIIDADCILAPGSLDSLAHLAMREQRAVQALDLMTAPAGAGLKTRIAEFAWLVRNQVRPLGWRRLGWPCQLMGTGMAFPWPTLHQAELASGEIVEDMQLGLHLAEQGRAPLFCPQALVTSEFPLTPLALQKQHTRWTHGHLGMLLSHGPALLWKAVRTGNMSLAAMALDLCVPPLASLALLQMGGLTLAATHAWWSGATGPLYAYLAILSGFTLAVGLAWRRHGKHVLSAADWLTLPLYVLAKLPMYLRFFAGRRQTAWVRTDRQHEHHNQ